MTKRLIALFLATALALAPALSEDGFDLDALMQEIDKEAKALTVSPVTFETSSDGQSIFINRPTVTGSNDYTIAYNIYDENGRAVNYFYSKEARVAATPGYGGLFNVFVVVTDVPTGEQNVQNIGWQSLSWPIANRLTVGRATYMISPDRKSVYVDRPELACRSGSLTIAYNIYDSNANPVNYFYSTESRVAATPGYDGKFNIFIVVTDTVTGEQDIQDIGWIWLGDGQPTVDPLVILTQPADQTAAVGDEVKVTVDATGVQAYLWQYSYDSGKTWTDCSTGGYNTKTYTFTVQEKHYARLLRCRLTSFDPARYVYTDSVSLSRPVQWPVTINGIHYDLVNGAVTATGADDNLASLVFVDEVNGLPVIAIADLAFAWLKDDGSSDVLTGELILPIHLFKIGNLAFYNRQGLTGQLVIPPSVFEIGSSAFCNCNGLTSVYIVGNNFTNFDIKAYTFAGCTSLQHVWLPKCVTWIGEGAFLNCSSLIGIELFDSVAEIEKYAFDGCTNLTYMWIAN